jgi:hypothetical protein
MCRNYVVASIQWWFGKTTNLWAVWIVFFLFRKLWYIGKVVVISKKLDKQLYPEPRNVNQPDQIWTSWVQFNLIFFKFDSSYSVFIIFTFSVFYLKMFYMNSMSVWYVCTLGGVICVFWEIQKPCGLKSCTWLL